VRIGVDLGGTKREISEKLRNSAIRSDSRFPYQPTDFCGFPGASLNGFGLRHDDLPPLPLEAAARDHPARYRDRPDGARRLHSARNAVAGGRAVCRYVVGDLGTARRGAQVVYTDRGSYRTGLDVYEMAEVLTPEG